MDPDVNDVLTAAAGADRLDVLQDEAEDVPEFGDVAPDDEPGLTEDPGE